MTPHKTEVCRAKMEMLLEYDMIEPSMSPWTCGVVMTKKKRGQLRFSCDFFYLNAVTIKDAHPKTRIDESLSHFTGPGFCLLSGSATKKRIKKRPLLQLS